MQPKVTLLERNTPVVRTLALRTQDGTCRNRPPRFCNFGALQPGERATVRVDVRTQRVGRFVNIVAVNTATAQTSRRGKRARARAVVTAPPRPRFAG